MAADERGLTRIFFVLLSACICVYPRLINAAPLRAGVAKVDITPQSPIWMAGYGDRTHASTGVAQPLWAKALAIDAGRGGRVVIVSTDLIGLRRNMTDLVAARAQKEYGLERSGLLFNSTHTHTGPLVGAHSKLYFDLNAQDSEVADAYARKLSEDLFTVIGVALGRLSPGRISYGLGKAHFAINRRESTAKGVKIGLNPAGPVDPDVPVVRVTAADGSLIAILFGYACHNTTLTGAFYQMDGDYAGYAEVDLEQAHPGSTAMFVQLAAGDQNPEPRGTLEIAEQHGRTLADEVDRVLAGKLMEVRPPIKSAFRNVELKFALHTRETFEQELQSSTGARARRARAMLTAYNDRAPIREIQYPIQAVRFGKDLTILALGGEVVVDYSLRIKREYPGNLIVAGYSNDVPSYIPSLRVLEEGGYEAVDSMIYYGQPGPYAEDVEGRVMAGVRGVMKAVGLAADERQ